MTHSTRRRCLFGGTLVATGLVALPAAGQPLVDGSGDTFGYMVPQLDIDTMTVTYIPFVSVSVTMTFHTPIAPASAATPPSLVGVFEFDTDQSGATGAGPVQNYFAPPAPLIAGVGVDFFADLFSELFHPGLIDIVSTTTGPVGAVPILYGPTSLSFTVPLAMLGGDDGLLNFTTIIGTLTEPTDATNVFGTSFIPSPGALALAGMAGLMAARRGRA